MSLRNRECPPSFHLVAHETRKTREERPQDTFVATGMRFLDSRLHGNDLMELHKGVRGGCRDFERRINAIRLNRGLLSATSAVTSLYNILLSHRFARIHTEFLIGVLQIICGNPCRFVVKAPALDSRMRANDGVARSRTAKR